MGLPCYPRSLRHLLPQGPPRRPLLPLTIAVTNDITPHHVAYRPSLSADQTPSPVGDGILTTRNTTIKGLPAWEELLTL